MHKLPLKLSALMGATAALGSAGTCSYAVDHSTLLSGGTDPCANKTWTLKYSVAVDWAYQPDQTWGQGTADSWCSGPYTNCDGVFQTPGAQYTGSKQFNYIIHAIDEMRIWWILNSESGYLESCTNDRVRPIRNTFGIFEGEAFVWCN